MTCTTSEKEAGVSFIYCAIKCYSLIQSMMGSSSSISAKSRALQSQLFNALVCQIIIPLIFLDMPITIFFILHLTNNGIRENSGYLSLMITFYPVVDPLPNFYIIKPYRNAIIMTKSPKEFGSYKYLLIFTSVFEVWYAVLEAYLTPIHFSVGTTDIVLISVNDKTISRTWIRILNSAYWGGFGATQSIYAVHFVYRYLAVSRNSLLETFDSWKLILWLLVPFSMGAAWSFLGLALCGPNPELTELVRKSVMSSFGESIDNFEYLGGTMYDIKKDGSIDLHYKFLISAALMSNIVSASFAIIIYCAVKCYSLIYKMMDTSITISPKSRAIQSQLFYALLFQIAIPTVLLDVPLTIFFGLNMTNNGIEGYSGYLSFAISLYPVIDPLPNFFVISPYRRALFGCCLRKKVTDGASAFANSDVQLEMRFQIPS